MTGRVIGITGAAGFIGSRLVEHFAGRGWRVRALQRTPEKGAAIAGVTRHAFRMPDLVEPRDFEGLSALVHAAVAEWKPGSPDSDRANLEGTRGLLAAARAASVPRVVFLSTLSAHDQALSHYGRNKLAVEALFDPARDTVLRLGLVMDRSGGLFGTMVETFRSSRVVPMVDGGRQPIQTLAMDDLVRIVERVIEQGLRRTLRRRDPEVLHLRDLYETLRRATPRPPMLVPVPLGLVSFGAGLLETLRVPSPVTRENVLGLQALRAFDTAPSLQRLGVELEPFAACAKRLLGV